MKTITFVSLCCIAGASCFFAGKAHERINSLTRTYNQLELTRDALKDYQIELYNDTLWLYDGQRFVGKYTTTWANQIDTILLKDNE